MKKIYTLFILCSLVGKLSAQIGTLVSIVPNSGQASQTLTVTITGSGTVFQSSSPPSGILNVYLSGPQFINASQIFLPTDDEHVDVQFSIPGGATLGLYNLNVEVEDFPNPSYILTLNNSFTIAPADGEIRGTVYNDANNNGIQDGGELGIMNQTVRLTPGNINVNSNASGDYVFPVINGSYTVSYLAAANGNYISVPASYPVTINNDTSYGNSFGLQQALLSIAPNYAIVSTGTTVFGCTITSNGLFTSTPTYSYLQRSSGFYNIYYASITPINLNEVYITYTLPASAQTGIYHLNVTVNGLNYRLVSIFVVLPPEGFITGNVFYDFNGNGIKDAGDNGIVNRTILNTTLGTNAISNTTGNYSFGTANGAYNIQFTPGINEALTTTSFYNVIVNNNTVPNNNFGLQINAGYDSLAVIESHGVLRCNQNVTFYLAFTNYSGQALNGKLYYIADPLMNYVTSTPLPTAISGDTLLWDITNLGILQTSNFTPVFTMPGPGININYQIIGQSLDALNNVLYEDNHSYSGLVVCSYDPNDKQVSPPGEQLQHYTLFGDDLDYTIRFQNTGNDTAFRVVIYDTLDAGLDLNTFQFITSSHTVVTELNPATRALKFSFFNILLPDSNVNEPGSNGFVSYRIHTLNGLPINTVINNTAYIVFDLNAPVVTNTTYNTMVITIPVGLDEINIQDGLSVYPNPFDESAILHFKNPNQVKFTLTITDIEGRSVFEQTANGGQIIIQKQNMNAGLYLFKLSGGTINYYGKFIIR